MRSRSLSTIAVVLILQVGDCSWFQANTAVISGAGVHKGQWGRILCVGNGNDLGENLALVCWDIWIPAHRGVGGWIDGHEAEGNCTFDVSASCESQSIIFGASVESAQNLINPDDLNITSNGLVYRLLLSKDLKLHGSAAHKC